MNCVGVISFLMILTALHMIQATLDVSAVIFVPQNVSAVNV